MAWQLGIVAGVAAQGVYLRDADLFVGTSAGAAVAVQLASNADIETLFAAQFARNDAEVAGRMSWWLTMRLAWHAFCADGPESFGVRAGRVSVAAQRTSSGEARRAAIAARLPGTAWSQRGVLITAVSAHDGRPGIFDRDSGVGVIDAVTASGAMPGVWPPVQIGSRLWIDGAMRSPANADLAAGHESVVILAPITVGIGSLTSPAAQAAALRADAAVALITPDQATRRAIGSNRMDLTRRAAAAEAGRTQARSLAALHTIWTR